MFRYDNIIIWVDNTQMSGVNAHLKQEKNSPQFISFDPNKKIEFIKIRF